MACAIDKRAKNNRNIYIYFTLELVSSRQVINNQVIDNYTST